MKYLLIGKNGFIAKKFLLVPKLKNCFLSIGRDNFNYYDIELLSEFIKRNNFTFVINAAGFTGKPNVDACEIAKYECLQGNAVLPGIIREVCEDLKIPWGHVFCSCIYSSRRPDGVDWQKMDKPILSFPSLPCSFYNGTKVLGEEVLFDR